MQSETCREAVPQMLSITDTARALTVCRRTVGELIRTRRLPSAKILGRRLVPATAVARLIEESMVR